MPKQCRTRVWQTTRASGVRRRAGRGVGVGTTRTVRSSGRRLERATSALDAKNGGVYVFGGYATFFPPVRGWPGLGLGRSGEAERRASPFPTITLLE